MHMKKVHIKSAAPFYCAGIVWILIGLIRPQMLLKPVPLLITAAISALAYFAGSKVFKGETIEVEEKVSTGNEDVDRQIEDGRRRLAKLQASNDQLPDPEISRQLDRMKKAGDAILGELEKNPAHYTEVRRFMNYFLPTAEKLVDGYVTLSKSPAKGENITSAMRTVENSLGMIADAFEKQLDSLFKDQSFDLEADVSVLETLLKSDGLVDTATMSIRKEPAGQVQQAGQ